MCAGPVNFRKGNDRSFLCDDRLLAVVQRMKNWWAGWKRSDLADDLDEMIVNAVGYIARRPYGCPKGAAHLMIKRHRFSDVVRLLVRKSTKDRGVDGQ